MIIVSSAPFATATSAMRLKTQAGTGTPVASKTSSSGALDPASSAGGSAIALASPTSR